MLFGGVCTFRFWGELGGTPARDGFHISGGGTCGRLRRLQPDSARDGTIGWLGVLGRLRYSEVLEVLVRGAGFPTFWRFDLSLEGSGGWKLSRVLVGSGSRKV